MTTEALPRRRPGARSGAGRRAAQPSRPRLRPLVVFTAAVIVAFFGMTYSRISLDRTAFELQELESRIEVEQERMDRLRVEAARLQDPAIITARAVELGLIYPDERTPLFLDGPAVVEGDTDRGPGGGFDAMRSERP